MSDVKRDLGVSAIPRRLVLTPVTLRGRDLATVLRSTDTSQLRELIIDGVTGEYPFASAIDTLLDTLKTVPNLTRLQLHMLPLRDEGVQALADLLPKHLPHIKDLDLDRNEVGNAGATALAGALPKLPEMTEFSIAYNRIGDDAMVKLAEGLSGLHGMRELSLIHNLAGDVGLKALVHTALPKLSKLERLSFGPAADCTDVTLSAEATKELADALPDMADLHVIEVVSDHEGRSSLDEAAAKRPDLRVNCWPAPPVHG